MTSIEYAFIAALISVAAIVGMQMLGESVDNTYTYVDNALANGTGR